MGLTACDASSDPPTQPDAAGARSVVEVTEAASAHDRFTVRVLAELQPASEHTIAVGTPGRVRSVAVDVGARVEEGAVLFRLDPRRDGLTLDRARANARRAAVDLQRAERDLLRVQALHRDGAGTRDSVEQAQTRVDLATAAVADAKAVGRLARHDLAEGTVRAPTAGIVARRSVEDGQRVLPGESLMVLDAEALEVVTWISERDVGGIVVGDVARVHSVRGAVWAATVTEIGRRSDGRTGNFRLRLRLEPDVDVRAGLTVEVELSVRAERPLVTIPERALVSRDRRLAAFVVDDGVARRVFPKLGPPHDGSVPVFSGIEPGESVVVSGASGVVDGARLEVTAR